MATLQVTGHGTRKLKPLSTSLSFRFEGGTPVQAVNSVTGEHVPDWRFSPIRIVPVITVTDPEGLIANGVHNSDTPTANMRWMCDDTGVNVLAGESPADMSMDTSASDLRGALNIRRNFAAGTLLRFEYEFATSAGGVLRTVKHSATVPIKVNQMADALVQVRTVYPRGQFVFFPQPTAPSNLRMQMQLYYKGEACPAAYRWFKVVDGNEAAIGTFVNELGVTAASVATQPNYRCKALDMRPEYAAAMETAMTQARADVYKKYLGDDWEAVRPTVRPNLCAGEGFVQNGGYNPVPIPDPIMAEPASQKVGISFDIRFISEGALAPVTYPELKAYIRSYSYPNTNVSGHHPFHCPYPRDPNITTRVGGATDRVSANPAVTTHYLFYPQNQHGAGDKGVKAEFSRIKFELIREDGLPDTTPYLPHIDELNA